MGLFYNVSEKEILSIRNNVFKEFGIPALGKKGFVKSPFKGAWHGEYDKSTNGYFYQFCRIAQHAYLEMLDVYIFKGDKRLNFYLCVFELLPNVSAIDELTGLEGLAFSMTVKNKSKYMKLRSDDYKGPPLFYMLFLPEHKIERFYTKAGYESGIIKLKDLIKSDMENIDDFVKKWHDLHKPNVTDWEGNLIDKANH